MPATRRTSTARQGRKTPLLANVNFDDITTEVLRLRCDQLKLSAIGSRQRFLPVSVRLVEHHTQCFGLILQ